MTSCNFHVTQVELFYFSSSWRQDNLVAQEQGGGGAGTFRSPQVWAYDKCFRWGRTQPCLLLDGQMLAPWLTLDTWRGAGGGKVGERALPLAPLELLHLSCSVTQQSLMQLRLT